MLPRIKINYLDGLLGVTGNSEDGLVALVCGATATKKFKLKEARRITSLNDLAEAGVTEENNAVLFRHVREFYRQAEEGTALVILGVDKTRTLTELCSKDDGEVRSLIESQSGSLRAVFVGRDSDKEETATEGISADVLTALPEAQAVAEMATTALYAPLFIVLEGRGYTGENLKDLSGEAYNRVAVLVGGTQAEDKGAALGILAGRVASVPVQRNVGRVRDGALKVNEVFLGKARIEEKSTAVTELYDKGYLTFHRYVGRTGYFFADDNLACKPTNDYAHIASRRVIDKAYRIAYDTLLDTLLDEIELNEDGTMQAPIITSIQQTVENRINASMTAKGELSANEGDGCTCYIDPLQNVVGTSRIVIILKVRPFGYARYIDVSIGFEVSSNDKKEQS